MLDQKHTIRDAALGFFRGVKTYVPPTGDDRLWFHDALHVLLNATESLKSEQIVAIYQSVLLCSLQVDRRKTPFAKGRDEVTQKTISEIVLPRTKEFVESLARDFNFKVSGDEIELDEAKYHFNQAKMISLMLKNKFGKHISEVDLETFMNTPFEEIQEVFALAKKMTLACQL